MGVSKEIVKAGDGVTFPSQGQTCVMHYTGTLADGSQFDSSHTRKKPFEFKVGLGHVIRGWDEAVPQMSKGEKAVLTCTPDYAYGAHGFPPVIPANATLTFEVELLDFYS